MAMHKLDSVLQGGREMRGRCVATIIFSVAAFQAAAETAPPPQGPGPLSATFPCDAFVKNPDGSWTPTRDVNIALPNGRDVVTVGSAVSFHPGKAIRGFDVAAFLEQQCPGR
jgi:hypothetical protein